MDERIEKLTDDVTEGLHDDPELRLDVRQELRAHLQETAESLQVEGVTDEESVAAAITAFGPPAEIATELETANKRRMTLRAYARFTLRAVLPTLAVILAVFLGYGRVAGLGGYEIFMKGSSCLIDVITVPELPRIPYWKSNGQRMAEAKRKQFISDMSRYDETQPAMKTVVEAHRGQADFREFVGYIAKFGYGEEYLAEGEAIDPTNAAYNYSHAEKLLKTGISLQGGLNKNNGSKHKVIDQAVLDAGIKQYLAGVTKPNCTHYQQEMLERKLAMIPMAPDTEYYISKMKIKINEHRPQFAQYRTIAFFLAGYMELLVAEGRAEEGKVVADSWPIYSAQVFNDNVSLYSYQSSYTVAETMANAAGNIYSQLGLAADVERNRLMLEKVKAVKEKYYPSNASGIAKMDKKWDIEVEPYTALLVQLASSNSSVSPTKDELAPSRQHERAVATELFVGLFCGILLIFLLWGGLHALFFRGVQWRSSATAPLVILPSIPALLRIVGYGVILPITCYAIYTQLPISGREYGLPHIIWRFIGELTAVALSIIFIAMSIAKRDIVKRCLALGIPVPTRKEKWRQFGITLLTILIVALLWGGLSLVINRTNYSMATYHYSITDVLAIALALISLYFCVDRKHALYHGTIARSLTPIYALVIILLAGVVQSLLIYQEVDAIRRDKVIFPTAPNFTSFETDLVVKVHRDFLQAIHQPTPAGNPTPAAK